MRLDFLLAGAQRSGTSSLWTHLYGHPQLNLPPRKETHFFDDETMNWRRPDYDRLHAQLEHKPGSIVAGEGTPITLYWTPAHYRVFIYNPDIKFILIFRDPIERAFSAWRMVYQHGLERLTFSEHIREGRLRVLADGEQPNFSRIYSNVERGMYGRQVKALLQLFNKEQMLFLRTVDLEHRPALVLDRVAEFLGIDPFPKVDPIRINLVPAADFPSTLTEEDARYLAGLFRPDTQAFAALTGLDVSEWRTMGL